MLVSINKVEQSTLPGLGDKIIIFGRDKNKKKIIFETTGHSAYLYVSDKHTVPVMPEISEVNDGFVSMTGKKLLQIVTVNSIDVPTVRKNFPTIDCYEDDILYYLRWLIDTGIKNGISINRIDKPLINYRQLEPVDFFIEPRRVHIDIEVLVGVGGKLPDWEKADKRISAISIIDNYTKTVFTVTNRPEYGGTYNKKIRIGDNMVLYSELKPKVEKIITKIKTEVGTTYKWIIYKFKTEILATFKTNKLNKITNKIFVENKMMEHFIKIIKNINPDFICGWNIENFDMPYIYNRLIKLNIDTRSLSPINSVYSDYFNRIIIKGIVMFDTMLAYKKMHIHTISGKLDDASNIKLGYGKIKYIGSLDNLYYNNEEKFLYYNAIDVIAEYEIYEKMHMTDFFGGLKQYIGCPYSSMWNNKDIVDFYFLSKAKEHNIVLPTNRIKREKKEFSGAYVPIPTRQGRTVNVLTLDLKSLYPTIMISWNLGNDTIIEKNNQKSNSIDITTPPVNGIVYHFNRDKSSFISECLEELIIYRDILKTKLFYMKDNKNSKKFTDYDIDNLNNVQTVVKFITNSIYGVLGYVNFRLYDVRIAECITTIGRKILLDTIALTIKHKYKVLGGDTDSAFVELTLPKNEKILEKLLYIFNKKCQNNQQNDFIEKEKLFIGLSYALSLTLNKMYRNYNNTYNIIENFIEMKPEDFSSVFFTVKVKGGNIVAKKHYAKKKIIEFGPFGPIKVNKTEIKGFNKSDISIVGNKIIETVMDFVTNDTLNQDILINTIQKYLRTEINKILTMQYPLIDICRRVGMRHNINEYANVIHARAARWTNENAKKWNGTSNLNKGSTIKYTFVKSNRMLEGYTRTDVIALDDNNYIPKEFKAILDLKTIINKTILGPLSEVLLGLEISYNYIKTGKQNKRLDITVKSI